MIPALPVLFAAHLVIAVADRVPEFNVEPGCKAAAADSIGPTQDVKACIDDERQAHDDLMKQWTNFRVDDRTSCSNLARMGGAPTYTELLTCLEMARDTRNLPRDALTPGEARPARR